MKRMKRVFLFLVIFGVLSSQFSAVVGSSSLSFIDMKTEYHSGQIARFTFYTPRSGNAVLTLEDEQEHVLFIIEESFSAKSGNNNIEWALSVDDSPLDPGTYILKLSIGGDTIREKLNVTDGSPLVLDDSGENISSTATSVETDPENNVSEPPDTGKEETIPGSTEKTSYQVITPETSLEKYSPSDHSPYDCEDENCFWKLPMGELNEQAIWDAMMQPITVVKATRDTAGDRQSFNIYSEPDENSTAVADVTAVSQGLHVLKTLDNGWSLVEGYSSSFHKSKVKNYGGFFQGYIKTSRLETKKPSDKYGILIDKLTQKMYILQDGKIISELLVSTGLPNNKQPYNETPAGDYLIVSWTGGFYSGNMYCDMALRINAGILLHEVPCLFNADGSRNYAPFEPLLGSKASHGCIRVQRALSPEDTNMRWLWDNLKMNTRVFIWEDKGRMREIPASDTPLYYNPDGGKNYHSDAYCSNVRDKYLPLTSFTYGQLDEEPFNMLTPCAHCNPPMRKEEIEAQNAQNALVIHDGAQSATLTVTSNTKVYYNPDGGMYYHNDQNCSTIHQKYLPLTAILYSELENDPFTDLLPCTQCNPPSRGLQIVESGSNNQLLTETDDSQENLQDEQAAFSNDETGDESEQGGAITFN